MAVPKSLKRKNSKEDEQTKLSSAYRHSKAKFQVVQTSYIKRIKLFLFASYNEHLINRGKWVCIGEF